MRDPFIALRDARLARLLRRSQSGDRNAFSSLYRALYGPVARFVGRRVWIRSDAEDVVAQVFLQLLVALPRVDPRQGSVLAYAFGIARNLVVDRARAARGPVAVDASMAEAPLGQDPHSSLEEEEERAALRARVATLPQDVQELLRLRFEEDLRYSEIAQIVGRGEAAVRQRISRAVRELRGTPRRAVAGGGAT